MKETEDKDSKIFSQADVPWTITVITKGIGSRE